MELINKILNIVGSIGNIVFLVTIFAGIWAWMEGILPSILRLGVSLSKRKIAIVAKNDNATSFESLLSQSKVFKQKNIFKVSNVSDFGMLEEASIMLVYWPDFKDQYEKILEKKSDSDALVIYAPQDEGKVHKDVISDLINHRNVTITNFRGRLVNDIFVSMITSGYNQT